MMSAHLPGSSAARLRGPAHQVGGVHGGGLQGRQRRHAHLVHIHIELMRVQPVRIDGGIGAQRDLHPGLHGVLDVALGHRAHVHHLLVIERRQVSLLDHPVFEVERGHQVGAVLLHLGDACVVDVAAVLDGVDAGLGGPQNPLRAMGVRGHLAAQPVRVGDDGLHLFEGVLRGLRIVALRQHAAGGADLDQVGAVLDVLPHLVLHGGDAVGHAVAD